VRNRFHRHLEESSLLAGCSTVLVAFSGGLDSVALLHLLRFGGLGVNLRAAHFDHRMRPGSDADAHWARGLCAAWAVPCDTGAAADPLRSEAHARDARYAFLDEAADAAHADIIVTAHHANDQAETLLFRLARGTGLPGLAGIPQRRGRIARPLLPFTRLELEEYARAVGLRWREDPTNLDVRLARNRIRHVVLPALEQASPGATGRIAALAERAAESEHAWQSVVEGVMDSAVTARSESSVELARDLLLGYHPHVRARVSRYILRGFGVVPDRAATAAIMKFMSTAASGGSMTVGNGVRIEREFDRLRLFRQAVPAGAAGEVVIERAGAGRALLELGGSRFHVEWGTGGQDQPRASGTEVAFDPVDLRFPLRLRGWQPGDRIRLAYGSKKLKKLFQERRVGRSARACVPVLVDAAGAVLWVLGVGRSVHTSPPREQRAFTITVLDGQPY
jgi:tRNA(Ile)-lysidine synthase